jgi:hypothetical protein
MVFVECMLSGKNMGRAAHIHQHTNTGGAFGTIAVPDILDYSFNSSSGGQMHGRHAVV